MTLECVWQTDSGDVYTLHRNNGGSASESLLGGLILTTTWSYWVKGQEAGPGVGSFKGLREAQKALLSAVNGVEVEP